MSFNYFQSESVAESVYNTKWYECDLNMQRSILLIIMRSRRPLVVHAGPLSYVSHPIIMAVINLFPIN